MLVSLVDKDGNVVDVQRLPGVLPGETVGVELAGNMAKNYTGDLKLVIGETNMDSNSVTKTIGGSGGCSAGFGALALLAIAVLPAAARRKR